MAQGFESVYTDQQREAIAYAAVDRGVRPAQRVVDLAAAGELVLNGETLAPFTVPVGTVRDLASKERRRRKGQLASDTALLPGRDGLEALRVRLVNLADSEIKRLERHARRANGTGADLEKLRQAARMVREIAAIPTRGEAPTAIPGRGGKGEIQKGGDTTHGPAAELLRAHRATASNRPAQDPPASKHLRAIADSSDDGDTRVDEQRLERGDEGEAEGEGSSVAGSRSSAQTRALAIGRPHASSVAHGV